MISISLCMIVKDEEDSLARCLAGACGIADEIIIVDTGSKDKTKELAARFTDKIYDFEWIGDFAAARNFAYSKAETEYILWLDADDILLPADVLEFQKLKAELSPDTDAVMMRYNTGFDKRGKAVFSYYRERLSKASRGFQWMEPVHEYLAVYGRVIKSEIAITHSKPASRRSARKSAVPRNIAIYERLLKNGETLSPRGMYYYARELKDNGRLSDAAKYFELFLDGGRGWTEDNINAAIELGRCHLSLGDEQKGLCAMFRSFVYDTPRAECCCALAYHYKNRRDYRRAVFWFELALRLEPPADAIGFIQRDCWGYIPCIECAVCYDRLNQSYKAELYNERAAILKPDSREVLQNREYFRGRRLGGGQDARV